MSEDMKLILERLDQLIRLLASNTIKGMNKTKAISALGAVGLDRNLVAKIVGTTPLTVSVTLSEAKRRKKRSIRKHSTRRA